jgi:peptide/nickel transport system ATP-binding protein
MTTTTTDTPGSPGSAGTGGAGSADAAVCIVSGLRVGITSTGADIVDSIDLQLQPGEVVGLVGESGSGKTTIGTAILGHARTGAAIEAGDVVVDGQEVLGRPEDEVRLLRGEHVAYMPQDPASALNPSIRIGHQIVELLELRKIDTAAGRLQRARDGLAEVGLPNDDAFLARYPHQLSGGQVQRVALAMAFLPRPRVLVLDEPTTGLDVTTQTLVLETMQQLCAKRDVAALYVTHDLAVIGNVADRVAVMYAGRIVELGPREKIFARPSHPYTRALLDAIPHVSQARALSGIPGQTPQPGSRPTGCRFHDRCGFAIDECAVTDPPPVSDGPDHWARCIRVGDIGTWDIDLGRVPDAPAEGVERDIVLGVTGLSVSYGRTEVVHDVSFDLARGECVALVGESGSGKTTISRSVGGLHKQWTGDVVFHGRPLARSARRRSREDRRKIQYIFQNPYLSLNPRQTVGQIVRRPMELFGIAKGKEATERATELLDAVALGPSTLALRTDRLSGGERQRVAIARALAAEPDVLVCDEITSALDVSVQGSIVELLERLRKERGIALLFVTHNLALVRSIAARVDILSEGRLVESGPVVEVMERPQQEYTRTLLANTPRIDEQVQRGTSDEGDEGTA